ncbi:MAG: hypothetical protein R3F61_05800 [Myxococcota bacterium]
MDLDTLQVAAALVSPWPTWRVEADSEAGLLAKLGHVGPVPQADLFEPWEEGDPWVARVVWPDLADPAVLLAHGALEEGLAPGLTEWVDRGRVGIDEIFAGPIRAVCLSDLERGGLLVPDLVRLETESPEVVAVGLALLASVGATTEADQVTLVQHRSTGRYGLLLEVSVSDRDPLAERQAVVDGVAGVLADAGLPVKLAPDLRWWFELQRVCVLAWLVAPGRPGLPPDRFDPFLHERHSRTSPLGGPGPVELHALLDEPAAIALGETLGALGFSGARSRWSTSGDEPVFLTCWEGPADAALPALDVPFRVVPGCPPGLEGDWLGIDPCWWASGARVVCRWHCALRDRDLLPVCTPREADAVDRALASRLALLGAVEPVSAGRPALRVQLGALDEAGWRGVVDALGALDDPCLSPVAWVAMPESFVLLLFRADLDVPEDDDMPVEPPAWEAR